MAQVDILTELQQNFVDFAYEANSERAFPDARDGLKPGQRACIWEMHEKGYTSNKPHVKSAKISGGEIASWWPHGDVAIYETFARMSQPWINNIPEIDWHGANGNLIIGNSPANQRYTEARLSKATEEGMLQGIKKHNVPMIANFSEDAEWPEVLPAIFPRLLVNGCQGIGVTIANTWLTHSLCDVAQLIFDYLDGKEINYNHIYPDFPTGGIIINKDELADIYKTGKGKVILRAKATIEGNKILITEMPYQVFIEPLIEDIKQLVEKGEIQGIKDVYNKSDKKKLLVEIDCESNAEQILSILYAKTALQSNYNANQVALVGKTPTLLTLVDYLKIYVEHNLSCIVKEYDFDLKKATARLEIVEGLLKALVAIDEIIALIKKSESSKKAEENLQKTYGFTENQAKAIVSMKLGSLARLEAVELEKEKNNLIEEINAINKILNNTVEQKTILKERLSTFVKKYGHERRTQLTQINLDVKEESEIISEDVVVILNEAGEIKRIPKASFKVQKRNGKGVKSTDSAVIASFSTNTQDNLLLFSSSGKMYKILVDNIPECTNTSRGTNVASLIKLDYSEKIIAAASVEQGVTAKYIAFVTKQGMFKKSDINEYFNTKRGAGIQAIKLKDGDSIVNVSFINQEDYVFFTHDGMSIHFETKDIRAIGRVTQGIKAMKLNDSDYVTAAVPLFENKVIAIITENGLGKKCNVDDFPVQLPNGKGVVASHSPIVNAFEIAENDNILIIGRPTSICIQASDLPTVQRASGGNLIIKDSTVISAAKI